MTPSPPVPMPDTTITVTTDPATSQPLMVICTSMVPPSLEGTVTVNLVGPSETAQGQAPTGAMAVIMVSSVADAGNYQCMVTVMSMFLTSPGGDSRVLEDTTTLSVTIQGLLII